MQFVNENLLLPQQPLLTQQFNASPGVFRFLVIDNFLKPDQAESLLEAFPGPDAPLWNKTTYINQKKKLQAAHFTPGSAFHSFFAEMNSPALTQLLGSITGIDNLTGDDTLFGGGLHQSLNEAFLDVHVDFNIHPQKKLFRRLNLLVFLNKNWKTEYGGSLELWNMEQNQCVQKVEPLFNRAVIFETTEKSYHGHPEPLRLPQGVTRKSVAVYYYTAQAPQGVQLSHEHNTVFTNTRGLAGRWRNLWAGWQAFKERVLQRLP